MLDGQPLTFFWDVKRDLGTKRSDVVVRLAAVDDFVRGEWVETAQLRVNNNDPPVATILTKEFVANPDQRRGIPVPFEVRDANGDEVRVVFQWRPLEGAFPHLPDSPAAIEAILGDPILRRRYQIATERPVAFEGRAGAVDPAIDPDAARKVRLMELASVASPLLHGGMVGRELEILRNSTIPTPRGGSWDLKGPVAAVPVGDETGALVLDRPEPDRWRLREMDLGDGKVLRAIASGQDGDPNAMAVDETGHMAVLAVSAGPSWAVLAIRQENGEITGRVERPAGLDAVPVRALAFLGPNDVLATAGSSFLRIAIDAGSASAVLSGLEGPWGIAVDPSDSTRVFFSERDRVGPGRTGRVAALDLRTLVVKTIEASGLSFERPEALALERHGTRLLVLTDRGGDGLHEIFGADVGAGSIGEAFGVTREWQGRLQGPVGGLATGADQLRILALPEQNDLAIGGGVDSRRTITDFLMPRKEATVDRPFATPLRGFERWRVRDRVVTVRATPAGVRDTFVWDSGDLPQGGEVILRAVPFDSEVGLSTFAEAEKLTKTVKPAFEEPRILGGDQTTWLPQAVKLEDLNGDGRTDIASANFRTVTVFFQGERDDFAVEPAVTIPGFEGASALEAADLDGDGLVDLAVADASGLHLFFMRGSGAFPQAPDVSVANLRRAGAISAADLDGDGDLDLVVADGLGNAIRTLEQSGRASRTFVLSQSLLPAPEGSPAEPVALALGDFDGDGRLDVASANEAGGTLTVFFRREDEMFSEEPDAVLGHFPRTHAPRSLAAADLDGDGLLDLASANQLSGSLTVFSQKARGKLGKITDLEWRGLAGPLAVTASDLSGDGLPDLAVLSADSASITLYFQVARGEFPAGPEVVLSAGESTARPVALASRDLDGDGKAELVSASALANELRLFTQAKPGFSPLPDLVLGGTSVMDGPRSLAVGDLDLDGDQDVMTINQKSVNLTEILQERAGLFRVGQVLPLNAGLLSNYVSIAAADLDGDSSLEVIAQPEAGVSFIFV